MNRDEIVRGGVVAAMAVVAILSTACGKKKADPGNTAYDSGGARPDTYPQMLNKDMPFRYPPALYAEKVQGNVTLRLFVDSGGNVIDDSTRVVESSKEPMLDSAAIKGSRELKFTPAKLHGAPMPVSILFPVYFRHPEAAPPPGDSILHKVPMNDTTTKLSSDSAKGGTSGASKASTSSTKKKKSSSHHRRRSD